MSTMKAIRIHGYGGRDVLVLDDAPRPTPGDHDVLVKVHASAVNPFDCALRAGYLAGYFNHTLPLIIGTDFAGLVEAVGSKVQGFTPGDAVFGRAGVTQDGANAEYVIVPVGDVALKPQSLDFQQSAALPHVSLAAWQALFVLGDLSEGQTVLIHGAAGGVGHLAAQLAKSRGARVIGTSSRHGAFLTDLKLDQVIDYSAMPFESAVGEVDLVLDLVGGETQERSWKVLRPGGALVSTLQAPSQEAATAHGVRQGMVVTVPPIGPTLTQVAGLVDSGALRPHVSAVLPLAEVARAHEMIETGHTVGKIVISVVA